MIFSLELLFGPKPDIRVEAAYSKLPFEIWRIILTFVVQRSPAYRNPLSKKYDRQSYINKSPLLKIAATSKFLYGMTASFIDHNVSIGIDWKNQLYSPYGSMMTLKHDTARSSRRCLVTLTGFDAGNDIVSVLGSMRSIHSLAMVDITLSKLMIKFLRTAETLKELHLYRTKLGPFHDLEGLDLTRLNVSHLCNFSNGRTPRNNETPSFGLAVKISLSCPLRYLRLESHDAEELFASHCVVLNSSGNPTLPSLSELIFSGGFADWGEAMELALGEFLRCTPNLTSLSFVEQDHVETRKTNIQERSSVIFSDTLVPRLQRVSGPVRLLHLLIPTRPIDSVAVYLQSRLISDDWAALSSLGSIGPDIRHLTVLRWQWMDGILQNWSTVISQLESLEIVCGRSSRESTINWLSAGFDQERTLFPNLRYVRVSPQVNFLSKSASPTAMLKCTRCQPLIQAPVEESLVLIEYDGYWHVGSRLNVVFEPIEAVHVQPSPSSDEA